jgi:hypothetical protein
VGTATDTTVATWYSQIVFIICHGVRHLENRSGEFHSQMVGTYKMSSLRLPTGLWSDGFNVWLK